MNRGIDIGEAPVDLMAGLGLEVNQAYQIQLHGRSRVWIGEFSSPPVPGQDEANAFSLNSREQTYYTITPSSDGTIYAWTDQGSSNRIVANEAS